MSYKDFRPRLSGDKKIAYDNLTTNERRILVVGDIHAPFELEGYLNFCKETYAKHLCNQVVFIGDIIDNHYTSYHETSSDGLGGADELHHAIETVKEWKEEEDLSNLRIIGYRNVWFKYHPAEADTIVPVSLNALDVLENSFTESYMSQVNASFPSYEYDGKFSLLAQKIWVEQLKQIQLLMGKEFFYKNDKLLLKATHGLLYFKEMNVDEFLQHARELEKTVEGVLL